MINCLQQSRAVCINVQVQRAAAGALRTLAFKNEDNKNQIVECGALPTLIQMLQADDAGIHYEAVGVIGNLVHSSIHIKRQVSRHMIEHSRVLLGSRTHLCIYSSTQRQAERSTHLTCCVHDSAPCSKLDCPVMEGHVPMQALDSLSAISQGMCAGACRCWRRGRCSR